MGGELGLEPFRAILRGIWGIEQHLMCKVVTVGRIF